MNGSEKFNFGDRVEDGITGFHGIVIAITSYATGCDHYEIQPEKVDERTLLPVKAVWIDGTRLRLLEAEAYTLSEEGLSLKVVGGGSEIIDRVGGSGKHHEFGREDLDEEEE